MEHMSLWSSNMPENDSQLLFSGAVVRSYEWRYPNLMNRTYSYTGIQSRPDIWWLLRIILFKVVKNTLSQQLLLSVNKLHTLEALTYTIRNNSWPSLQYIIYLKSPEYNLKKRHKSQILKYAGGSISRNIFSGLHCIRTIQTCRL